MKIFQTLNGFKILPNEGEKENVVKDSLDHINDISDFIKDTHENGIIHAITGQYPGEWCKEKLIDLFHLIIDCSDVLIVVSMFLGLGALAGSEKCKNYLYWSCISFVILKLLGGYGF